MLQNSGNRIPSRAVFGHPSENYWDRSTEPGVGKIVTFFASTVATTRVVGGSRSRTRSSRLVRLRTVTADPDETHWPAALTTMYLERYDDFVRVAYLIVRQAEVAEEVTQDAFVAAHRRLDHIESLGPYLHRSVVNGALSWHRRQKVERSHLARPAPPAVQQPDEMWDALERLAPRRRAALVLRYYEQLPDAEIAEMLDCARSTVRTLIARALADLRKEIER